MLYSAPCWYIYIYTPFSSSLLQPICRASVLPNLRRKWWLLSSTTQHTHHVAVSFPLLHHSTCIHSTQTFLHSITEKLPGLLQWFILTRLTKLAELGCPFAGNPKVNCRLFTRRRGWRTYYSVATFTYRRWRSSRSPKHYFSSISTKFGTVLCEIRYPGATSPACISLLVHCIFHSNGRYKLQGIEQLSSFFLWEQL